MLVINIFSVGFYFCRETFLLIFFKAVIDCFSRKNWVRPMKTATAEETAKNLDEIINSMAIKPTQFASGFFIMLN